MKMIFQGGGMVGEIPEKLLKIAKETIKKTKFNF